MQRSDYREIWRHRRHGGVQRDLFTVAKRRRMEGYSHRWDGPYLVCVGDGLEGADDWGRYVRALTRRPGWSVARLAREANIHRSTIFGWIKEGGAGLTVASVLAVADAAHDDRATALLAAGNLLSARAHRGADRELAAIAASKLPEDIQRSLIDMVMQRREREEEHRRREEAARLEDVQRMIRHLGGEVRDVG